GQVQASAARVEVLEKQLGSERAKLADLTALAGDARDREVGLRGAAEEATKAIPNVDALRVRLTEVEATNAKVRANQKYANAQLEIDNIVSSVAAYTKDIEAADEEKRSALAAVQFPVPGLGLSDDGITFNDLPFAQAGGAEQ